MEIDIRMATKRDSLALRQFAEHALTRKIGERAGRILRALMWLKDVNSPRGGVDNKCHVRLEVAGGGDVSAGFRTEEGHGPAYIVTSLVCQLVLDILASPLIFWFSRQRECLADSGGARLAGRESMMAAF